MGYGAGSPGVARSYTKRGVPEIYPEIWFFHHAFGRPRVAASGVNTKNFHEINFHPKELHKRSCRGFDFIRQAEGSGSGREAPLRSAEKADGME
jgi:hypothetical protein